MADNIFDRFKDRSLYYFSRVVGKPLIGPDILQLGLTHRCNLRCSFCDVCKETIPLSEEMSTEKLKAIIKDFNEIGGRRVFFVGGEPLIRKDIFELISYVKSLGMQSLMSTNGTLITKGFAKKIVSLPLSVLMYSIDGPDSSAHDKVRGKGVYAKMMEGLSYIREEKARMNLGESDFPIIGSLSIVMDSNLELLIEIVKHAQRLRFSFINFQPIQTNNTIMWQKDTDNPEWIKGDRLFVLDKMMDEIERYRRSSDIRIVIDTKNMKDYFLCKAKEPDVKCFQNYLRVVVKPDCTLWSCRNNRQSLKDSGLGSVWYGEEMDSERRSARSCDSVCMQRCIYLDEISEYSDILRALLDSLSKEENMQKLSILKRASEFLLELKSKIANEKEYGEEGYSEVERAVSTLDREIRIHADEGSILNLVHDDVYHMLSKGNMILDDDCLRIRESLNWIDDMKPISYVIITKDNLDSLGSIIDSINYRGGKKISFVFLDNRKGFEDIFYKHIPSIPDAAHKIKEAKEYALSLGLDIIRNPARLEYEMPKDLLDGEIDVHDLSHSEGNITASVIIPTTGRISLLSNTLECLNKQTVNDFEVIIVGDGDPKGLLEYLDGFKKSFGMRYISWKRSRPFLAGENQNRAGPVRNLGVRNSAGDNIIFLDDDMIVQDDFIERQISHLKEYDAVIGPRYDMKPDDSIGDIDNLSRIERRDFMRWVLEEVYDGRFADAYPAYKCFFSCNMGIRREAFLKSGGFDHEYVCYGIEDEALGYKVMQSGFRISFERDIFGFHQYHKHEGVDFFRLRWGRMYNHERFYKRFLDWDIYNIYILHHKKLSGFDITLKKGCNNRCLTCNEIKGPLEYCNYRSIYQVKEALQSIKKLDLDGYYRTNIYCEVMHHKGFVEILPLIEEISNLTLYTNGRIFSYLPVAKSLPRNIGIIVNLFGASEESCDVFTQTKGSFRQTMKGIRNLDSLKKNFRINVWVDANNIDEARTLIDEFGPEKIILSLYPSIDIEGLIEIISSVGEWDTEVDIKSGFQCIERLSELKDLSLLGREDRSKALKKAVEPVDYPYCTYCRHLKNCRGDLHEYITRSLLRSGRDKREGDVMTRLDRLLGILENKVPLTGPAYMEISISNYCDQKCCGCWVDANKMVRNSDKDMMNLSRLKTILIGFGNFMPNMIQITGHGEPLYNPDVVDIVREIKRKGIRCSIDTNGQNLGIYMQDLIGVCLDGLNISLWAGDEKTYLMTHPRAQAGMFHEILESIQYIQKNGSTGITLVFVLSNINFRNLKQMYALSRSLDVNYAYFCFVDVYHNMEYLMLTEKQLDTVREDAEEILRDDGFKRHNLKDLLESAGSISARDGCYSCDIYNGPCYVGWIYSRIDSAGDVISCPFMKMEYKPSGICNPMGNAVDIPFSSIWEGERYQRFRKSSDESRSRVYRCRDNCVYFRANERIHKGISLVKAYISKNKKYKDISLDNNLLRIIRENMLYKT